ncbi:MAG: AAA family ATPase [Magnetococcales bacterium]|nr:AAA family ATPase [Magnetococcales bacterium]
MAQMTTPAGGPGREAQRNFANDFNGSGGGRQVTSDHYGRRALAGECASLASTQSNRNDALNMAAFRIGQLIGGGLIERGEAEAALTQAALAVGLSADEAKSTIRSGLNTGMKSPRKPEQAATRQTSPRPAPRPQTSTLDKAAQAVQWAVQILRMSTPVGADYGYLKAKGIEPTNTLLEIPLKLVQGITSWHPQGKAGPLQGEQVLVAGICVDGNLSSLAMVDEAGRKSFLAGGQIRGGYWPTGDLPNGDGTGQTIIVAEGVADSISCWMATGCTAVAGLADGNLPNVAKWLRNRFPEARIVVVADLLADGSPNRHAAAAAQESGGLLAVPRFGAGQSGKDINDFHKLNGLDATRQLIEQAAPVEAPTAAPEQPAKPVSFSMVELMAKTFDPVEWCVTGLLSTPGVYLMAGAPKAGKSWLCLHLLLSVAYGRRVFGSLFAAQGTALYVSLEDHQRRLQNRISQVCHDQPTGNVHFALEWPRIDQGGVDLLDKWLTRHLGTRLVILDTLARIKPPRGRNGDLYAEDYQTVASFKALAEKHSVTVLIVHHTRKMVDHESPANEISGTTGLAGGCDGTLVVKRKAGSDKHLTLHRSGRDLVDDSPLEIEWDREAMTWRLMGEEEAARASLTPEQTAIIEAIRYACRSLTRQEIAEAIGKDSESIRSSVARMVKSNLLLKVGKYHDCRYDIPLSGQKGDLIFSEAGEAVKHCITASCGTASLLQCVTHDAAGCDPGGHDPFAGFDEEWMN